MAAAHLWVQLRDGADAQGQGLVDKRSLHVVHLESRSRFSIEQQNLVPCFQTWWEMQEGKYGSMRHKSLCFGWRHVSEAVILFVGHELMRANVYK